MGFLSPKRSADEIGDVAGQPAKGTAGVDPAVQAAAVAGGASSPAPGMAASKVAAESTQPMNDILLQVLACEVHQVRCLAPIPSPPRCCACEAPRSSE